MQLSHRLSPLQEREDAGNRTENLRLSWERDFAAYLDTVRTTHPDQHSARLELAKAVEHDPQSAGAWWAFLRHEESAAPQTSCATPRGTPRSQSTNLCDLYRWATRLVPRPDNSHRAAFVKLWLGYARQQWLRRSDDDARDTFKTLKSQQIGEEFAIMYAEWAGLEAMGGNTSQALSIVSKGIKAGAEPKSILTRMKQDLTEGRYCYAPFYRLEGVEDPAATPLPRGHHQPPSFSTTPAYVKLQPPPFMSYTPAVTPSASSLGTSRTQAASGNAPTSAVADYFTAQKAVHPTGSGTGTAHSHASGTNPYHNLHNNHTQKNTGTLTSMSSGSGGSGRPSSSSSSLLGGGAIHQTTTLHSTPAGVASASLRTGSSAGTTSSEDATVSNLRRSSTHTLTHQQHHHSSSLAVPLSTTATAPPLHTEAPLSAAARPPSKFGMLGRPMRVAAAAGGAAAPSTVPVDTNTMDNTQAQEQQQPPSSSYSIAAAIKGGGGMVTPGGGGNSGGFHGFSSVRAPPTAASDYMTPLQCTSSGGHRPYPTSALRSGRVTHSCTAVTSNGAAAAISTPLLQPLMEIPETAETPVATPKPSAGFAATVTTLRSAQQQQQQQQQRRQLVLEDDGPAAAAAAADEATVRVSSRSEAHLSSSSLMGISEEDPGATVPLSRPVAVAAAATAMPPPPPPPIAIAPTHQPPPPPQQQQQRAVMPPPQQRAPNPPRAPPSTSTSMPPPPPLPAAAAAAPQAGASSSSSGRRVIEDEDSVVVRGITYTKLECVGRGGSSKVYKVMAPNKKIFALKRIRLNGCDAEAAAGFLDEITLLTKLRGKSNIIQLIDSEVHRQQSLIYMVLEYGDIDLARLLQKQEAGRRERAQALGLDPLSLQMHPADENFIRLYWQQMLLAVETIHRERIVHSDLKPANFLVVEGQLKLIDFGIAKAIQSDTTSIARESQVGTLNYMSPEAILGGNSGGPRGGPPMKVGRASDIWSLGCIIYQMTYGRTPFAHLPFIQKMHAITNDRHQIEFPPLRNAALLDVIQRCLDRNPRTRITMADLLDHSFLSPTAHNGGGASSSSSSSSANGVNTPMSGCVKDGAGNRVELNEEQLRKLLMKVYQKTGGGGVSDLSMGQLSGQLFRQLAQGSLSPHVAAAKMARSEAGDGGGGGTSRNDENVRPMEL